MEQPSDVEFVIGSAAEMDVPELIRIGNICGLSNWSATGYSEELKRPDPIVWIIRKDREIVGLLVARITRQAARAEAELFNIAVLPEYRDIGLGSRILDRLIERCRANQVEKIWLDVRISNTPAKNLYRSRGFREIGARKNFYSDPSEDSLSMTLDLNVASENP